MSFRRRLANIGLGLCIASAIFYLATPSLEAYYWCFSFGQTLKIGGNDKRAGIEIDAGDTNNCSGAGTLNFEADWDDGDWDSTNATCGNIGGSYTGVWFEHTFPQNGTYHAKFYVDGATGSCLFERTFNVPF